MCCPSAQPMQRLLCASEGFWWLAGVGNGGVGHVPPKSQLSRTPGARKRICNPTAPACAALSLTSPNLFKFGLNKSKDNPAVPFPFFSAVSLRDVPKFGHPFKPNRARLVTRASKEILHQTGQVSLHLVFATDSSDKQSRGTEIPLLKENQAPKGVYPSQCYVQTCMRNIPK